MGDEEPLLVVGHVRKFILTPGEEITLTMEIDRPGGVGTLTFSGVRNLHVSDPTTGWPIVLQVVDISDRGWEGVGLEITDPEEGSLRFWCREVVADGQT